MKQQTNNDEITEILGVNLDILEQDEEELRILTEKLRECKSNETKKR